METRCHRFIVAIENEDAPENFSYLTGAIPSCGLPQSFQDFKRSYLIGYEGRDMFCRCSHKSDKNVSLLSVLHKDGLLDARDYVEKEFAVVE
jgi:hypothetical protein